MNRTPPVDPAVQQQMNYNDRISSRLFVQNNQKATLNIRDKNMIKMPKNNNAFLNDRSFTDYNVKGSHTKNFANTTRQTHEHEQYSNFGPYSQVNNNEKLPLSHSKPTKNIDLEYNMRIPVNKYDFKNDPPPGNISHFINDKRGRREYEHKYVMSQK